MRPLSLECLGLIGREHDLAAGGAGRGRQALGDHLAVGVRIDGRVQQLVERGRIDTRHRFVLSDQALVRQLDRDPQRRPRGALAGARLQHPQLALLDREFEVLHVAVVTLERLIDAAKLRERLRHRLLHRGLVGARRGARGLGDLLRRADAGDHVLALRVDQELAVELLFAGRRVAGEGDAGRRGVAHVAEHHGLHVDGGAPAFRDAVQTPVRDRARVHPGAEHRADRAPQLVVRVLRKIAAGLRLYALLVARDHLDPVVRRQVGVEHVTLALLVFFQDLLEVVMLDAQHDVRIHGDEAPVAVVGEAPVLRTAGDRVDRHVVEAEIEHRVHHPGHRGARAGAHRHQQRIGRIAEGPAGQPPDLRERGIDLRAQVAGIGLAVAVEVGADLGGDGEAGRHRQAEVGHFGKVRALAAEHVAHLRLALGLAVAEGVDPLRHQSFFRCRTNARAARLRGAPLLARFRGHFNRVCAPLPSSRAEGEAIQDRGAALGWFFWIAWSRNDGGVSGSGRQCRSRSGRSPRCS